MGIFDNLFNGLFSKQRDSSKVHFASDYSLENISTGLGISKTELEKIMQANGIIPVNNMLTQTQVDAIYDSYYRSFTTINNAVRKDRESKTFLTGKKTPIKVSPSQIIREYSSNPATLKYKNKWISFSGTVKSTYREGQNFAVEILSDDKNFFGTLICKFVNNAENKILVLKHGDHLNLTGFLYDVQLVYQHDTIVIINCNIVDGKTRGSQSQIKNFNKKVSVSLITKIPDSKIRRSMIPGLNDKVYTESGKIYTLTQFISSGGEGSVYSIDAHGRVAKIYNEKSCTTRMREKIRLMVAHRLNFKGICFP
ncbi:MAG: hypothetical protein IJ859_06985, partial [Synergistaceae bacterium]|nr:hypothetical protein [Synergistaceae bacterium]MBR2208539.1 hypothetical protein [Synergistaceae bacterium]